MSLESLQSSLSIFISEFENLKVENEKLRLENEKLKHIKFSKFHDLTFLYPGGFPGCVDSSFEDEYHKIIKNHIYENKHKYNDGDIIFIGSAYETRQEYGFATIKGNYFISGEYPQFLSGFYYRDVINDINKFWNEFVRLEYYNEETIEEYKKQGKYEP